MTGWQKKPWGKEEQGGNKFRKIKIKDTMCQCEMNKPERKGGKKRKSLGRWEEILKE